jgi:hypothetical protein
MSLATDNPNHLNTRTKRVVSEAGEVKICAEKQIKRYKSFVKETKNK